MSFYTLLALALTLPPTQAGGTPQASCWAPHRLNELAVGVREQQQGIVQIGEAVHNLDAMTQQNAALVEQTAAAAATMRDQANVLVTEVAFFKL